MVPLPPGTGRASTEGASGIRAPTAGSKAATTARPTPIPKLNAGILTTGNTPALSLQTNRQNQHTTHQAKNGSRTQSRCEFVIRPGDVSHGLVPPGHHDIREATSAAKRYSRGSVWPRDRNQMDRRRP